MFIVKNKHSAFILFSEGGLGICACGDVALDFLVLFGQAKRTKQDTLVIP